MSDDAILDMLASYALGALSGDEARAVEQHLPTCDRCRHELAAYEMAAGLLDESVVLREAPAHLEADLRARLEAVGAKPATMLSDSRRPGRAWRLVPAALAAIFALVVGLTVILFGLPDESSLDKAEAILASTDAVRVAIVPNDAASGIAGEIVFDSESSLAAVSLDHLPPLPSDKEYQLWLVAGDDVRDSAGTWSDDRLVWLVRAPQPIDSYDAVGVTIEPLGGMPAPTGPRVFSAALAVSS